MTCAVADVFLIIGGISLVLFSIFLIIFIVKWIRKKPKKIIGFITLAFVIMFIGFESIGVANMHKYEEIATIPALCTETGSIEYQCIKCGKKKAEIIDSLGHNWKEATCTEPKVCMACGVTEGEHKGHTWEEATCTQPKSCTVCGITEGETIEHNWKDATCTSPKICSNCGLKEGDCIEHNWKAATCTEPKLCIVCGLKEGVATGHKWKDATYSKPKTCIYCGATEGEPLSRPNASEEEIKTIPNSTNNSKEEETQKNNSKTVYITPTGKRYHYSKDCAGKNAIETTLDKAKSNHDLVKNVQYKYVAYVGAHSDNRKGCPYEVVYWQTFTSAYAKHRAGVFLGSVEKCHEVTKGAALSECSRRKAIYAENFIIWLPLTRELSSKARLRER